MKCIVHCESIVIVGVPDGYMIVFTSDTFHAGLMPYDRKFCGYFRIFIYIVEQEYVLIQDDISKIQENMKCKTNCDTCREIQDTNIYNEGRIIKYCYSKYNIDRLPMGVSLLSGLKSVLGCIKV